MHVLQIRPGGTGVAGHPALQAPGLREDLLGVGGNGDKRDTPDHPPGLQPTPDGSMVGVLAVELRRIGPFAPEHAARRDLAASRARRGLACMLTRHAAALQVARTGWRGPMPCAAPGI